MMGWFDLLFQVLLSIAYLPCPLLAGYWLYRLWRRTDDAAYVWLMAALGVLPVVRIVSWMVVTLIYGNQTWPAAGSGQLPATFFLSFFMNITVGFLWIGFMVMGLRQLGGGCVGFRALFSWGNQPSEEGDR